MAVYKLMTPEGTKDYLFDEVVARNFVIDKLQKLFMKSGYCEVCTPAIEYLDVFEKGNGISAEQMYKLTDHEGRLMVLRPDSTTPIARVVATRLKTEKNPIRLFYNQSVFTTAKKMSGKSDEILQMGVELISNSCLKADMEVLAIAIRSLGKFSPYSFRMEIGHIGIFNHLIEKLSAEDKQKEEIRLLIKSKNYPALNDLLDSIGNSYEATALKQLPTLFGGEEVFQKALEVLKDDTTIAILKELQMVYSKLKNLQSDGEICVDLGIVNRTNYYTGIVFEGYMEDFLGQAVLVGGRYDTLTSQFTDDSAITGATGFAVNIDAASSALIVTNLFKGVNPVKVMVHALEGYETEALQYMEKIANNNQLNVEFSLFDTVDECVEYAKEKEINNVYVVSDKIEKIVGFTD